MTTTVSLVNYGVGNLGSVRNMFKQIGVSTVDVTDPEELLRANRILLPGVGAFDHGMTALTDGGWIDPLRASVKNGTPLLGICLGMQLLLEASDEGISPGLGLIPGRVKRFGSDMGLRIPHMGWNLAAPARAHRLFTDLEDAARFYFVHSYYAEPERESDIISHTTYGLRFASAIALDNVIGVQFHPEKSHHYGMQLLQNFSQL